jgi:hypothetical protein
MTNNNQHSTEDLDVHSYVPLICKTQTINIKIMNNEIKQTAIEWLLNEWPILKSELPHWLIEQAKEMEKQQIIDAYYNGTTDEIKTKDELLFEAEHFYNETYGGDK